MKKIGFIGTGVMGRSMAINLVKAGYEVSVYNRSKEKTNGMEQDGIIVTDTIECCVKDKDVVITIVGYPKDVEEVYFSEKGIFAFAKEGTYLIDMTTTSPRLSMKIYEEACKKNLFALDAPVSGGDTGAKNGTLAIMVGGEEDVFDHCKDIFDVMGKTIIWQGKAGSGQHAKMANQIAIAGTVAGVCEAISYGKKAGLSLKTMLDTISTGAAGSWQMTNNGYKMIEEDYAPGFYTKHFIKDMAIADEMGDELDANLVILKQVLSMFRELEQEGAGDEGTQVLIKKYLS